VGHTGFNVHSRVRAPIKAEAERIGKYMIRPILALGGQRYQVKREKEILIKRTLPAIDISRSGARKEELLIDKLSKTKPDQDFMNAMSKGL
jgi:hypothetical protein